MASKEYIKQWQAERRAKLKAEGYKQVNFMADPDLLKLIDKLKKEHGMTTAELIVEALEQMEG